MVEKGFDIESLLRFKPPRYLCEKCKGIFPEVFSSYKLKIVECPICKVKYLEGSDYSRYNFEKYLDNSGFGLKFDNLIEHCRKYGAILNRLKNHLEKESFYADYPPMRALLDTFLNAQKFIHFSSYGISFVLYGALKAISQRVSIRGIISNVKSDQLDELTKHKDEAPQLDLRIFQRGDELKDKLGIPHQKFIIIDGLIAFKGSANLTLDGWRKFEVGREIIEFVTDVNEVIELNNRYFSPIWAEGSDVKEIQMLDDVPF